jgi:diguanylate cyclase (GGDEF)-like protein
VDRASTWLPAPCWAVVSADLSGQLSVLADRGLSPDMGPAVYAIAKWVMHRNQEFVTADMTRDSRLTDPAVGAVIAIPLSCRGRRVGALVAIDRQPSAREPKLSESMLRAVRVLLEPASVALDNSLLLKRAEALSVTDDLTSLYNSRYLNLVLRRETKRASRSGRPLSLLFIDLDGFKAVNDTHGHLFGSRALVEAAAVIRSSARETDVVARFGGDEFALILPDTGGEGAFAVGERIRERIAAHRAQLERYEALCEELGVPPADVALAWVLHNAAVTAPILGPRTLEQLREALRALELHLDAATLQRLDEIWPGPGGEAPEAYAW